MNGGLSKLWQKDGTKSVLASLISILIGMAVGGVIILASIILPEFSFGKKEEPAVVEKKEEV